MRFIGLDVHRDFCEVAIAEGRALRSAGRIETTPAALRLFAESLGSEDSVALEATTQAAQVARLIEPHVARVVIANTRKLAAITQAKAKTDRLDTRTLARLLASGYLEQVWAPDEETRSLRRLVARRSRLVRARTRAKNEVHGVLLATSARGPR
jgi:transposase